MRQYAGRDIEGRREKMKTEKEKFQRNKNEMKKDLFMLALKLKGTIAPTEYLCSS